MHTLTTVNSTGGPAPSLDLARLIRSEYEEMPGLCLTRAQVQRYWLLDPAVCDSVLTTLVENGVLRLSPGGYVRV